VIAGLQTVRFTQGWAEEGDVDEAVRFAREVTEDGGEDDPTALVSAAHGIAYLARDYDAGLAAADRALSLAPNSTLVLLNAGWIRAYVGDSRTAITLLERAMRLSPVDAAMFLFSTALGLAHYTDQRYGDAAEWAGRALHDRPTYLSAHRLLATSLAELGRLDAAREAVRALLAAAPDYTAGLAAAHSALRDPALRERYLDGLRRAGLPE
jgi:adenylate cyclase